MIRRQEFFVSRAQAERRRAEELRKDDERHETMKRLRQEKVLEANMASDERVENKRYVRRLNEELIERETVERLEANEKAKILREKQLQQEAKLASQLQKIKLEEQRKERLRHLLKETSPEIRELESKLRAGYTNKERAVQLLEKEAMKEQEKRIESMYADMLRDELRKGQMLEAQQEEEKSKQVVQYQNELEDQLREQEQKRVELYEEFLKEKLMIDEICRQIYEEDQREFEARLTKQRATREYIEDFKRKRDEWKALEKARMEEENRKILEFSQQQEAREGEKMAAKKERVEAMAAVQDKLAKDIEKKRAQQDEMERIITELYLEEQREHERQQEKAALETQLRMRLELQNAHKDYQEDKARKEEAMRLEEEEYRRQMMEKFAEDDRIEQMNAQKRRMKQLEHGRAVQKLIEARRAQFERQKELEMEELKEQQRAEDERKAIIEQERQRLLREHASKLLGYLPKGVLRDEMEVNFLGDEFVEAYKSRHRDPLDDF